MADLVLLRITTGTSYEMIGVYVMGIAALAVLVIKFFRNSGKKK